MVIDQPLKNEDKAYSTNTSINQIINLIDDQSFKSNLTGKEYKTISYDRLSCGSTNVIYVIHIVLIVLLFMLVKLEGH